MTLKDYQKEAIDKLLVYTKSFLGKDGSREIVFKSPTGSGKTIMMADWFNQFAQEEVSGKYAFLWATTNSLHIQSKEKLESYLGHSRYNMSLLDEINTKEFKENDIVFVNWESLTRQDRQGDWSNLLMKDNEEDRNLKSYVQKAKESGIEIILIVDESQRTFWSDQTQQLVQTVIQPKLTIEVSATPKIEVSREDSELGRREQVTVPFCKVVESGIIKKEIIVNPEIGNYVDLVNSSDEALISASLEKREKIKSEYKSLGKNINPLVMIQLPGSGQSTSALDKDVKERVIEYLDTEHSINFDNGKLAIWLSEEKENLANLEESDNQVEVLIFKQAIATGWDCPRADILVMLREIQSVTFKIQTVGRVLRMPEAMHYDNDLLDRAYVFSNIPRLDISSDENSQNYFKVQVAERINGYKDINLPSISLSRTDFGDLTLSFRKIFIKEANKKFGITAKDSAKEAYKKADVDLELYPEELTEPVISDAVIENIDDAREIIGDSVEFNIPEEELKYKFTQFAKLMSKPFAPVRSHTKIQQAFYDWFDKHLGYEKNSRVDIQRIVVCSKVNQKIFAEILDSAKEKFKDIKRKEVSEKQRRKEYIWNVPKADYYNESYEKVALDNYVMKECYLNPTRSQPEKDFENQLAGSKNVEWWYKNGVSKESYFAIPYVDKDGFERAFYPDFIVKFKDKSIGIYDTKSGFTVEIEDTARKYNAFVEYKNKNKKLNIVGGIVAPGVGGLKVFIGKEYNSDLENKDWVDMEI